MTARPEPSHDASALEWTVHPARRDPARTALLLFIVALVGALVWIFTLSPLLTVLACALLLASLRAWFLPRTYRLDGSGAREAGPLQAPRRLLWSEIRRVTPDRNGVHLSPLHRTRAWLPDRGLFLRTGGVSAGATSAGGDAERVLAFVRSRQGAA